MKVIKIIIVLLLAFAIIGYGVYYFGTNMASEKLMETVTSELENSGEIEKIKQVIETDPELQSFINEVESTDTSELPFSTKEEATRVLINKIGIGELNEIRVQVQDGTVSKEEILQEVQSKLTEEEILALKVIAYKELYGQ